MAMNPHEQPQQNTTYIEDCPKGGPHLYDFKTDSCSKCGYGHPQPSKEGDVRERIGETTWHYWRECPNCGYCGTGYLHCAHDGFQSPCHRCGISLPTLIGECECEFVVTEDDAQSLLKEERRKSFEEGMINMAEHFSVLGENIAKAHQEELASLTHNTTQE